MNVKKNLIKLFNNKLDKIKVLIVDDSEFISLLVSSVLKDDPELDVVGNCYDGDEVVDFLKEVQVDVILMDIEMKRMNGDIATIEVLKNFPKVKVVAFSSLKSEMFRSRMIQCGAQGFVYKGTPLPKIAEIIKSVADVQGLFPENKK